jgi:hypothetical protein
MLMLFCHEKVPIAPLELNLELLVIPNLTASRAETVGRAYNYVDSGNRVIVGVTLSENYPVALWNGILSILMFLYRSVCWATLIGILFVKIGISVEKLLQVIFLLNSRISEMKFRIFYVVFLCRLLSGVGELCNMCNTINMKAPFNVCSTCVLVGGPCMMVTFYIHV